MAATDGSVNIGFQNVFDSDAVLDPRMGMPLFGIGSEKELAGSTDSFALTPRMFDSVMAAENPFDYGHIFADFMSSELLPSTPPTGLDAPCETNREAPPAPTSAASPTKVGTPDGRSGSCTSNSGSTASAATAGPPSQPSRHGRPPRPRSRPRHKLKSKPGPAQLTTSRGSKLGLKRDAKRSRCLERNRIAASKCREKKKQWVHNLETTKDELESRHTSLQSEYGDLCDEATQIKTSLMAHAACNDRNIDMWIKGEAVLFVLRCNQVHRHGGDSIDDDDSRRSRSSSRTSPHSPTLEPSQVLDPSEDSPPPPPELKGDHINFDYMLEEMLADVQETA